MGQHKIRSFSDQEVDEIRDKVVYLVGKEDPFQKLGGEKALKDYQMNARFFERAGHGINHELSEKINHMIIDIMQDNIS
jgi:hypothetical protein